jgi:GntR family transcriptional regulator
MSTPLPDDRRPVQPELPEPSQGSPAYRRIQKSIRDRIEVGTLGPGDPVESERELARIHGVSLMTARHALGALEREGLVERRRGSGTFVTPPRIHFNLLTSFTEHMAARGLAARSRLLYAREVHDEGGVAARLSLPTDSPLVRLERLRLAGSEPLALETTYLPATQFGGLLARPLEQRSLFNILHQEYGTELAYADEEIDATGADARSAELLGVPRLAPLLRIRQVIYSTEGRAAMYVLGLYRSDRHTLQVRRYRR